MENLNQLGKSLQLSLTRIEFKIIEENKANSDLAKIDEISKVTEIKDSILNYNRINPNLNFDNFIHIRIGKLGIGTSSANSDIHVVGTTKVNQITFDIIIII